MHNGIAPSSRLGGGPFSAQRTPCYFRDSTLERIRANFRTTHHFHLFRDGGSIEIASNDAADAESQKAIRNHLSMIAERFSQGDFGIPMFIHATIPPGVETMKRLNKRISYLVRDTIGGAEIRITSDDSNAIRAVHDFLRFQITDHRTGDSLQVQP